MHPPGRKVYERGAHVIYEIDGAKDKVTSKSHCILMRRTDQIIQLYCQNLSLFGKFFIDIKTVFYDCENCTLVTLILDQSIDVICSPVLRPDRRR